MSDEQFELLKASTSKILRDMTPAATTEVAGWPREYLAKLYAASKLMWEDEDEMLSEIGGFALLGLALVLSNPFATVGTN